MVVGEGKAEVLDLIINTLKEHEKSLDGSIEELRAAIQEIRRRAPEATVVECESWTDFKMRGRGAKAVAFQMRNKDIILIAVAGVTVYRYILNLKGWLSEELNVPAEHISD
ncbi:MAG: hypothetical protein FJZ49_00255 [Candidatus Verstraetearchaeota archaeon]|nr:hypothetical protein [Candidatus Verstraetearchaeota archaeon]